MSDCLTVLYCLPVSFDLECSVIESGCWSGSDRKRDGGRRGQRGDGEQ